MLLNKLYDVSEEIVIITGVNGQLGSSYAKTFLVLGARVVGLDLQEVKQTDFLKLDYPNDYCFYKADVTNKKSLTHVLENIELIFGTPTVLINNAAIDSVPYKKGSRVQKFPTSEMWDMEMNVSLKGSFFFIKFSIR